MWVSIYILFIFRFQYATMKADMNTSRSMNTNEMSSYITIFMSGMCGITDTFSQAIQIRTGWQQPSVSEWQGANTAISKVGIKSSKTCESKLESMKISSTEHFVQQKYCWIYTNCIFQADWSVYIILNKSVAALTIFTLVPFRYWHMPIWLFEISFSGRTISVTLLTLLKTNITFLL